jgi:hypothetical protein
MRPFIVVPLAAAASFFASCARADCDSATSSCNMAISNISSYMSRYTSCLRGSDGQDDCSSEFRRLRSAQSDFEMAVLNFQTYCRR